MGFVGVYLYATPASMRSVIVISCVAKGLHSAATAFHFSLLFLESYPDAQFSLMQRRPTSATIEPKRERAARVGKHSGSRGTVARAKP